MEENKSWVRRHKILTALGVVMALFFAIAILDQKKQGEVSGTDIRSTQWDAVRASDPPRIVSGGWFPPVRLEVSEDGNWMDGLFVTLDGSTMYFNYYPGDLLNDWFKGRQIKESAKMYYSRTPFMTKVRERRYFMGEDDPWSSGGPSVTNEGAIFYQSNRPTPQGNPKNLSNIYKNDQLLAFNDMNTEFNNAKYCGGRDELWMDTKDKDIYVLKHAEKNKFAGTPERAPEPVNTADANVRNAQPWLSEDCNVMYFSSTRSGKGIYVSERTGDAAWSSPKLVISSKNGVGQPSLTKDMKKLFFIQVLQNAREEFTTNLFYVERK